MINQILMDYLDAGGPYGPAMEAGSALPEYWSPGLKTVCPRRNDRASALPDRAGP